MRSRNILFSLIISAIALVATSQSIMASPPSDMPGITATDLTVSSDGVMLAATVLSPAEATGLGVVMLPGSGPAERSMIRPAAEQMAMLGVTVLIFDKRGSGESEGSWITSSLDDLAADAMAGMEILRARPDITSVGLWGHSQGNWVATRADELDAEPGFMIAVSGGGASPREVETYAYEYRLSAFPETEQKAGMELVNSYFDYLSGKISWLDLKAMIDEVETTDWYQKLGLGRVLISEQYRDKWAWVADYEPGSLATERQTPTLVLLGGADHTIPFAETISDWNSQLSANETGMNQISILVAREHHLRETGAPHGGYGVSTDKEVWAVVETWLETQLVQSEQ